MKVFDRFKKVQEVQTTNIYTPVGGKVIDIKETKDQMFSMEVLGKGVGIIAKEKTIVAPSSGTISTFFPTKHAIGITTDNGVEILIHVGIDTVELNGKYFEALKKQGESINEGDALLNVEFEEIEKAGYDATVMMVITNTANYKNIQIHTGDKEIKDLIIEVE